MVESLQSFRMSGSVYAVTKCHISEDLYLLICIHLKHKSTHNDNRRSVDPLQSVVLYSNIKEYKEQRYKIQCVGYNVAGN